MPFCVWHIPYRVLWRGHETRNVQIDFSVVFDRIKKSWDSLKFCSVGVEGSVLSVVTQYLSNQSQYVEV